MVDLETMSTRSNAAICSIGAVKFEGKEILDTFYCTVDIKSCKDCGTIKTNLFTQTGLIALDAFRLRKMLPHFEKFLLKFKIPIDYD